MLYLAPPTMAETCTPGGLPDTNTGDAIGGIDWTVRFSNDDWEDCGDAGDYFSTVYAGKIRDQIMFANGRQGDWGFPSPWFNGLPDVDFVVFDSDDTGTNNSTCCTLDAPNMRCTSDRGMRWVVSHELFHAIQRRHEVNGGLDGSLGFGAWLTEGTARCLDDRYDTELDGNGPFITDTNRLMNADHDDLGPYRNLSLSQMSYRACLFWGYCCEQLGQNTAEPDSGVDFIWELWNNVTEDLSDDGIKDAFGHTRRTISELGGGPFNAFFHDFATAVYTREFDVSALPNAGKYSFFDETPAGNAGAADYADMTRTFIHDSTNNYPKNNSGSVRTYGHRYYEAFVDLDGTDGRCRCIGVTGSSDQKVGWSVVAIKDAIGTGDDRAIALSKQVGKEYGRAFLHSASDPVTRLGIIVVGLEADADFEYTIDAGLPSLTIVRPLVDPGLVPPVNRPSYVGPSNDPGRFLARLYVDGPAGLKPPGVGNISIKGLRTSDFGVQVGTKDATIINSGYVGGEYWLVVQAPEQDNNGAYDLTVSLCPDAPTPLSSTNTDAVIYGDFKVNHMLVIDRSGSMGLPNDGTGTKLEAAQSAATLYVDSVGENDRVGVTWFSGNDSECDDDATLALGLDFATTNQRDDARQIINNLTPSGWTSIGDGIWKGQDGIDAATLPAEDIKWMVLLSDGDENEARFWLGTIACGGDLGDSAKSRIDPTDTAINCLAFGPESDQKLMQDISAATGGDYSYIDVTDSLAPAGGGPAIEVNDLAKAYMDKLEKGRNLERLFFTEDTVNGGGARNVFFDVEDAGVTQGTMFVHWPTGAGAVSVTLFDPNGQQIGGGQATIYSNDTHKVYHLNGTMMNGTWRVRIAPTNDTKFIAGLLGKQLHGVQLLADVSQVHVNGQTFGAFQQGVPVHVGAILTDSVGPILDATVSATVRRPDGTLACGSLRLMDDGANDDGEANDGIYAALFTDTSQAGTEQGVINDDPNNPPGPGQSGSYHVELIAVGESNMGQNFFRADDLDFHVFVARRNDEDEDNLPDTWEHYYGTDFTQPDAEKDSDEDGLTHLDEFKNGTDPFDQDTDDGGESDASEVAHGRCPLDPTDDLLPCPFDVEVVTDTGDQDADIIMPLANLLIFPVYPSYQRMHIYRADELNPNTFVEVANLPINGPQDGSHYDTGLVDGRRYYYRFQAEGAQDALSCMSRTVEGVAHAGPPVLGGLDINNGAEYTDRAAVLVTIDLTTGADKYRLSNTPITGVEPLVDIPASPYVNWNLTLPAAGEMTTVHAQYVNTVTGVSSASVFDTIIYDRLGDPDGDTIVNVADPDDDGDGLLDTLEIFTHHTDAYKTDSDEDGLGDNEEVLSGCTNPRDPDTDGDGMLDGMDASPNGDLNGDHETNMADYEPFQNCFTGANNGPVVAACRCVDVDGDDDVDLVDFEGWVEGLNAPQP